MILAAAVPARAQSIEVSPLVGYASAVAIDRTAAGVDELEIKGGFTWAGSVTYLLSEHIGLEGVFSQQATAVRITSGDLSADLFDMTISQVLGNVVYQPLERNATLQPYLFGGAGISVLTASDIDAETKFAWNAGAGIKWLPTAVLGGRFQVRYKATQVNDDATAVCNPFGFCQGALSQFEFAGGIVLRF
jgi:opacity protein-like surface antigen